MSSLTIHESGMAFGPFPAGQCFHIERSHCYRQIQNGIQIAQFLLLRRQQAGTSLWVVEAKSSSPRPETQPGFDGFIEEIRAKLTNAFLLGMAAHLQRHPHAQKELPADFRSSEFLQHTVRFVLVIHGHKAEWLPPLKDELSRVMRPLVRTWGITGYPVIVLNDTMARKVGLIQ